MTAVQQRILLVLGGIVGVTALVTLVVLNTEVGRAGGESEARTSRGSQAEAEPTEVPATPTPVTLQIRAVDVTNVRSGPGLEYAVVAGLDAGETAAAVARDEDGTWLRLDLPSVEGSETWVSAEVVEITGDVDALPVATADEAAGPPDEEEDGGGTGVDLFIGSVSVDDDGFVTVVVGNSGPEPAGGSMVIRVTPEGGSAHDDTVSVDLPAGELRSYTTSYRVTDAETVVVRVDPEGAVDTVEAGNNSVRTDLLAE